MNELKVEGLSVRFHKKVVFENLTFKIGFPAFVAVIGSNGSGKTSFFKCLLNSIEYGGKVTVDNLPLSKALIASLPQQNTLSFDVKVKEVVVMGLFEQKKKFQNYTEKDYHKSKQALRKLGVEDLYEENFQNLSGGEQQLVWIAQLLLQDKSIWLLDEPLQQLDTRNKVKITSLLQELAYKEKKMVFCITHDLHFLNDKQKGVVLNMNELDQGLVPISKEYIQKRLGLEIF